MSSVAGSCYQLASEWPRYQQLPITNRWVNSFPFFSSGILEVGSEIGTYASIQRLADGSC